MPALGLDEPAQVSERSPKTNVIVNEKVSGAFNNFTLKNCWCHQTMPAVRPGVAYFVRLYDRARHNREAETFGKGLGHSIRDGIKSRNFIGGYSKQVRALACHKFPETFRFLW
jgi:hypothetical protein